MSLRKILAHEGLVKQAGSEDWTEIKPFHQRAHLALRDLLQRSAARSFEREVADYVIFKMIAAKQEVYGGDLVSAEKHWNQALENLLAASKASRRQTGPFSDPAQRRILDLVVPIVLEGSTRFPKRDF